MKSMFLNPAEITELTGHVRCNAQKRELLRLGIEHKSRADGSLIILRAHIEQELGLTDTSAINITPFKINMDGINA